MDKKRLSKLLEEFLAGNDAYNEAFQIVTPHSKGKLWLIGGFVFRSIAHKLYGTPPPTTDVDFIIERPRLPIKLPKEWRLETNRNGNPRLIKSSIVVDFIPLHNIVKCKKGGLEPTIENVVNTAPLTVQAIAYDIYAGLLIGEVGIQSLLAKTIQIYDHDEFIFASRKKYKGHDLLYKKNENLNFKVIEPITSSANTKSLYTD